MGLFSFVKKVITNIQDHNDSKILLSEAREESNQKFFRQALGILLKAQFLSDSKEIQIEINNCRVRIKDQNNYEYILAKSKQLASDEKFQEAINLFSPALSQFYRTDGRVWLTKLEKLAKIAKGKEYFIDGLKLEKQGMLDLARDRYQQATKLTPELTDYRIRLGIVATKSNNFAEALLHLQGISGEQAAYFRGFAHAQQRNWQQADREWQSSSSKSVQAQRQSLSILAQRERLAIVNQIEQLVDRGNLDLAKSTSLEFIRKFGVDHLVENNLKEHIQPLIETQIWKTQDWEKIAVKAESLWIESQDLNSLHNWAVSTYYQAQVNPNKLVDLIVAWSTALVNINADPSLKDLPWLKNKALDLRQISTSLTELLERSIDTVKDKNIKEYLQLRDCYRWESVAIRSIESSPDMGVRVKQVILAPGCYQRYLNRLPKVNLSADLEGALYTNRGKVVAACMEGDLDRALKIKKGIAIYSDAERFADSFISYHEACYYFQKYQWRKAINILKQIQKIIRASDSYSQEIDRLCVLQRKQLENFNEHLEFAKSWYDLLESKPSRSYVTEYRAREIADKLANEKIGTRQALSELNLIKKIDACNPVLLDLIEKVEFSEELEQLDRLLKSNQFEQLLQRAKRSTNHKIRFATAEIFIDMLINGANQKCLNHEEIYQLGYWAYQLCPHEPAFMEIYRSLNIY